MSDDKKKEAAPQDTGIRERKRLETRQRIAETALGLFVKNGYDETTLDDIAEAAEISRRTVFSYFSSKEDILLAWQSGIAEVLRAAVLAESTDQEPIDAVANAMLKLASAYNSEDNIVIDRLLRSTETLRASKQVKYIKQEEAIFQALITLWPQPGRRQALRVVAMASVGALRLATEAWAADNGAQPVSKYLRKAFSNLKAEI